MPSYICMIFSTDDQVLRVETFERGDISQAKNEAIALTTSTKNTRGYQLWCEGKKVDHQLTKRGER